jgi:hypothetical protein
VSKCKIKEVKMIVVSGVITPVTVYHGKTRRKKEITVKPTKSTRHIYYAGAQTISG